VTDLLGHIGYVVLLVGLVLIGQRKTIGWPIKMVGELIWVGIGFVMGMTSIWLWGLSFTALSLVTWRKWKCDSSKTESPTS